MKRIIIENPHTFTYGMIFFARKNGHYTRPILGDMIDLRLEDTKIFDTYKSTGLILPLPNIKNQQNKFLIITNSAFDGVTDNIQKYIATGRYLTFPSSSSSPLWQITKRPWWEYGEITDTAGGIIKAALFPRPGEATAENTDELIDTFPENRGKIEVLAPSTIKKLKSQSYADQIKAL